MAHYVRETFQQGQKSCCGLWDENQPDGPASTQNLMSLLGPWCQGDAHRTAKCLFNYKSRGVFGCTYYFHVIIKIV